MPTFVHGSKTKVYGLGYDLSSFFKSLAEAGTADTAETSTFGNQSKTYIGGLTDAKTTIEGFFDGTAVTGIDAILAPQIGLGGSTLAFMPGGDAFGARAYGIQGIIEGYEVKSDIGSAVAITLSLQSQVNDLEDGFVSVPLGSQVATGNGTGVDGGASSANGMSAYLQVMSMTGAGGNLSVVVQDSPDNITYTDRITFSAVAAPYTNGAAANAQRGTLAGTVARYVRTRWTFTTITAATFQVVVCRF